MGALMTIRPEVLDALVAAGATPEMIVAAVKADQARSSGASRQAAYRARKAASLVTDVTQQGVTDNEVTGSDVTEPSPEVSPKNNIKPLPTPNQSSLRSVISPAQAETIFENEFWPAYPRRNGSNPKHPAKTKFVDHVRKGVDPAEIVAGAKAYAAFMAADDPKFVKQAEVWLNKRCWADEYGERAQPPPKPKRDTFEDTANWFLKGTEDGNGSRSEESPAHAVELSPDEWRRA